MLWGMVASTLISSVGTIFIARLLGSDQYGLYGIVLSAPSLIAVVRNLGVNSAMIRFTAQYRVEKRPAEIRSIFASGIIFEISLGVVLSILSLVSSDLIAISIFNRPEIAPLIQIASFTILTGGLISAATAAFTGMEKMHLNSIMLISQSSIKTAVIILLVLLGFGTSGATVGHITGTAIAGLIGILLVWTIYKKLPEPATKKLELTAYTQTMLSYGIPLSLATLVTSLLTHFYTFLLPIYYLTDNVLIGNYNVAVNFVVLITLFATPITTMLFPAFSKLDYKKDKEPLKSAFKFSVKYSSLLVVPVAALIMCLSEPAVSTLFGATYDSTSLFLALLSITYLYTAFGYFSNGSLINSQGHTSFNFKLTLLTAAIGFPMGYLLIMAFGVLGLIATSLTAGVPSLIIGLNYIRKQYGVTIDWVSSAKILFSSAAAAALTYALIQQLPLASWIQLVIGVVVFTVAYIAIALLTRAINRSDIDNLCTITSSLGPLSKLINFLLNIIEKLMNALKL